MKIEEVGDTEFAHASGAGRSGPASERDWRGGRGLLHVSTEEQVDRFQFMEENRW